MRSLPFCYRIRRSQRAKHTRIVVTPAGVEVVAPFNVTERRIKQFVCHKRDWICKTLNRLQQRQSNAVDWKPSVYQEGVEIPYQGKLWRLSLHKHRLPHVCIEFNNGFSALLPECLPDDAISAAVREALIQWMHRQAALQAEQLLLKHASRCQLWPRSLNIKRQKSRWGSCGIHNDIYLNWVLILVPETVLEYVLVHELCHIEYRNHSPDFWALVAKHMPNYRHQRNWLKDNGMRLMAGL